MVKIKTKKKMSLPQLIEWGCMNEIEGERYLCNKNKNKGVSFNSVGNIEFDFIYTYSANDTFTVEVEKEITKDIKISKSLAIFELNGNLYSEIHGNKNINDILKLDIKVKSSSTKTIHMVNDDGTHTLLWCDGKLVE